MRVIDRKILGFGVLNGVLGMELTQQGPTHFERVTNFGLDNQAG
jgi:hypothetical protein